MLPFLDSAVCHWRVPGDIALALSYPVLWYRMYAVGISGVSTETQILHLLTFFFRYVCYPDFNISMYNSFAKAWYTSAATLTVAYLLYMQRGLHAFKWTHIVLSATSIFLFVSAIITLIIIVDMYREHVVGSYRGYSIWSSGILFEAAWTLSQLIAVGAMIPQLVILYKGGISENVTFLPDGKARQPVRFAAGVDVWMWTYVVSVAAFRTFYIPHWVWRYNNERFLDPISQICAAVQLAIIYSFILAIVLKNKLSVSTPGVDKPVAEGPKVTPCPQGDKRQDAKMPTIVVTDMA